MKLSQKEKEGVVILTLEGQMVGGPDATQLTETLHDLIEHDKKQILVDLKQIDWMNSSGLGILIGAITTVRNYGGELKLMNLSQKPMQLLKVTHLDRVFDIFDSEELALASF
ncbi:STAS domain-containing protein [candidate division KSB1 bacterium]|nr:STAS domain-containing protein [candidate division KSB1 bacterium]